MTRPEEIDAALALCRPLIEEWNKGRGYLEHQRHCEAGDALCRHINTLARLLRAANPPAGAERATETVPGLRDGVTPEICLSNGTYLNFNHPTFAEFGIEEIAQALSKLCRFVGQTRQFYSVAQHSVAVSLIVPPQFALHGLLHDAVEAFVGDMTKPLKSILPGYKEIEQRVASAVLRRFGIDEPLPSCVGHADLVALKTERRDLMPEGNEEWAGFVEIEPLPEAIVPLMPDAAYRLFMDRYNEIVHGIKPEPTTPAVGEDEKIIEEWGLQMALARIDGCYVQKIGDAGDALAARVSALLADVARLTETWTPEVDDLKDCSPGVLKVLVNFWVKTAVRYCKERDEARATLAAEQKAHELEKRERERTWLKRKAAEDKLATVRKIAENYHDVDVDDSDPLRLTASNPCAAEILNVLEGRST